MPDRLSTTPLPVIVVSFNTRDLLRRCLETVMRSADVEVNVLVVDNASTDGSGEMVRSDFPRALLLPQASNLGFAAANNVALRALGFGADRPQARLPEFVLLLNPDTEVRPDALATLLAFLRTQPRAGAAGGQLLYPDGRFQHSAFAFPSLSQVFLDFFPVNYRLVNSRLNGRYPQRATPFEVDHPLGAGILVRGEVIQQVGLMDEGFFMYVEEVDWCRRIRRAGWQIWCEPRAVIVHHEGQSTRQFRQAMFVALWESRFRYFRKYHSRLYVGLVKRVVRLGLWYQTFQMRRAGALSSESQQAQWLEAFEQVKAL
ncbi:MAG: glycosyltransferase family 2 protein [Chloroflexi bacterium]|nr:glycosyltransferase family 2 protein [Chloroflexota bacterium]